MYRYPENPEGTQVILGSMNMRLLVIPNETQIGRDEQINSLTGLFK